ncbi:MAG: glycosyltransferase [Desulfobacterales bacterium]|nr:glycosyltransferase [Desulfobacterales bacterium]MDX2510992.1 glycosyltransferase [Desulfobacterales bacterium]
MTGYPIVSVVIPTHNRGWVLKEAIESVLAQTFESFELIVVDDGSPDNTRALLDGYEDLVVLEQTNKGVSAARNRGIALAQGELIAFLDSDDLWLPEKLFAQVTFFQENPDALICQTQETWIRNGQRIYPKSRHMKQSGLFFERSLELCLVSPSAVMIKKRLFETVGMFDEDLPACEDYDLWLRINATIPIFLIDEALVIKRGGHADQLSSNAGLDKYRIQSIKKLLDSGTLSHDQQEAALSVMQNKCQIYASGCRKRGKLEEMAYYLGLASYGA